MADEKKRLMEARREKKQRKPTFSRKDYGKKSKLSSAWRSPKGLHNKIGDNRRGKRRPVRDGWQSPAAVRGLTRNGLLPTVVARPSELAALDPKQHEIVVAATVGAKKRIAIIEAALAAKFTLLNASEKVATQLKDRFSKIHKQKQAEQKKREAEHEKLAKEADKKEKEEKAENKSEEKSDDASEPESVTPAPAKKAPSKKSSAKKAAKKSSE